MTFLADNLNFVESSHKTLGIIRQVLCRGNSHSLKSCCAAFAKCAIAFEDAAAIHGCVNAQIGQGNFDATV